MGKLKPLDSTITRRPQITQSCTSEKQNSKMPWITGCPQLHGSSSRNCLAPRIAEDSDFGFGCVGTRLLSEVPEPTCRLRWGAKKISCFMKETQHPGGVIRVKLIVTPQCWLGRFFLNLWFITMDDQPTLIRL